MEPLARTAPWMRGSSPRMTAFSLVSLWFKAVRQRAAAHVRAASPARRQNRAIYPMPGGQATPKCRFQDSSPGGGLPAFAAEAAASAEQARPAGGSERLRPRSREGGRSYVSTMSNSRRPISHDQSRTIVLYGQGPDLGETEQSHLGAAFLPLRPSTGSG